jgi:hypothetical protein
VEPQQSTFSEIIESEHDLVLQGAERYGAYHANALGFTELLQTFLRSAALDRFVVVMFISQIRKHITLAFLSTLRLHHVQAMIDLRQALEAGACAAYAIANPDVGGFADIGADGLLDAPQDLAKKRYAWLDKHYPHGSTAIKNMKASINQASAHTNIVYAHQNFTFVAEKGRFETPFFDIEDGLLIKTDLWMVANISMGLVDLCCGVNKDYGALVFVDDYATKLKRLEAENQRLKAEMLGNPQLAKWASGLGRQ